MSQRKRPIKRREGWRKSFQLAIQTIALSMSIARFVIGMIEFLSKR